jgi:hypothetical protein
MTLRRSTLALALCAVAGASFAQSPGTPAPSSSAADAYRALDTRHRGYLTRDQVNDVQGFSFAAADTNKDGHLTRDEFARAWSSRYDGSPYAQ